MHFPWPSGLLAAMNALAIRIASDSASFLLMCMPAIRPRQNGGAKLSPVQHHSGGRRRIVPSCFLGAKEGRGSFASAASFFPVGAYRLLEEPPQRRRAETRKQQSVHRAQWPPS
jgi:hypothetical protein